MKDNKALYSFAFIILIVSLSLAGCFFDQGVDPNPTAPIPSPTPEPCLNLSLGNPVPNPAEKGGAEFTYTDLILESDIEYPVEAIAGWTVDADSYYKFNRWTVSEGNPNIVRIANPFSIETSVSTIYCGNVKVEPIYTLVWTGPMIIQIPDPVCSKSIVWTYLLIEDTAVTDASGGVSDIYYKSVSTDLLTLAFYTEPDGTIKEFDHWEASCDSGISVFFGDASLCYTTVNAVGCGTTTVIPVYRIKE
jgi:hypothetical protein